MSLLKLENVKINSIGAIVPKNIVSNRDYEFISPEDREKLIQTVGIEERRFVDEGVTTSDLSIPLINALIEKSGWERSEIGALVFVSQMRDYVVPSTAAILQDKLNLSNSCLAFDIPLGCSGYVYGLYVVGSLLREKGLEKAILIAGDVCSPLLSFEDKSTYPLFGDAASCTLLEFDLGSSPMYFNMETDGSGFEAIIMKDGGTRNPFTEDSLIPHSFGEGISHSNMQIHLDGFSIFQFAVTKVIDNIRSLLSATDLKESDIDQFIFHQANKLIIKSMCKILKIDMDKVPLSLDLYGNTSSASIPLTLCDERRNKSAKKYLLPGFGVGLSYASVLIDAKSLICHPIMEYSR